MEAGTQAGGEPRYPVEYAVDYPDRDLDRLIFPHPDVERDLNRWLPLVKWFLAIPHYVVLVFLWLAAVVCVIIAWFAFLLVADEYPPFRLEP